MEPKTLMEYLKMCFFNSELCFRKFREKVYHYCASVKNNALAELPPLPKNRLIYVKPLLVNGSSNT